METVRKLRAFVETARAGTLSAAARKLHMSPSAVTKCVNELESDVGRKLFVRSTRQAVLTDMGQAYLEKVGRILQDLDEMRSGSFLLPDALEGRVRVKLHPGPLSSSLTGVLLDFRARHPGVKLDLSVTERPGSPLDDGFDVSIGFDPMSYERVHEERIQRSSRILCASRDYLDAKGWPRHPRDLGMHVCLAFAWGDPTWSFQDGANIVRVIVDPALVSNRGETLRLAAVGSQGIAELSSQTASADIRSGALVPLLQDFPLAEVWLKLMVPNGRLRVARVAAIVEAIRVHLAAEGEPHTEDVVRPKTPEPRQRNT